MPRLLAVAGLAALTAWPSLAQRVIITPQPSPAASVTQEIGLTQVTIDYHRPGVRDREVWGALVPWDQVWRAGANENTVFTTTTDVTIEGQPLPAGSYGLHTIPGEEMWTIIFSSMNTAWGSFTYDEAEDVLRVEVKAHEAPFRERLLYAFDDVTDRSATARLDWAGLAVPFEIGIDFPEVVLQDIRGQLRDIARFSWQGWNQAARWSVDNGGDLEEAAGWADQSLARGRNFTNLMTRSDISAAQGDDAAADETRAAAFEVATEAEINAYGYQLFLGRGDVDAAIEIFRLNTERHPDSWNVWDSLAEALAAKGDAAGAIENYEKALGMVSDETQKARIEGVLESLR